MNFNKTIAHDLKSLATILNKEISRIIRIWGQTFLPPMITINLYFLTFGTLIGERKVGNVNYMQYILPGLILMSIITNSYSNASSSFYTAKFMRSLEQLLVSSTPKYIIMLGYILAAIFRGMVIGILVLLSSLIFVEYRIDNLALAIFTALMTSMTFAIAGLINGIYARKWDDVTIVPTFIITPMVYLGGVFFSITHLSIYWQHIAKINPILYMINSFRYSIISQSDVSVSIFLPVIIVINLVLLLVCYIMLKRVLNSA